MDDASLLETKLKNGTLHGVVVGMGVDSQMRNLSGAEIEARTRHTARRAVGGDTVDGAVRFIAAPGSILNYLVGRLFSHNEGECAHHTAVLFTYVAHAIRNVGARRVGVGIFPGPLRGISLLAHEDASRVVDGSDRVDIGKRGLTNLHATLRTLKTPVHPSEARRLGNPYSTSTSSYSRLPTPRAAAASTVWTPLRLSMRSMRWSRPGSSVAA